MVEVKVYKIINSEDVFASFFGLEDTDTRHKIFDEYPNEKEFRFTINCDDGLVSKGPRIYDILRTSGKTIHCNLLANPAENRTTNQNAIINIYAKRTGHNQAELKMLMKEEKQRTTQELLNYGFISKINLYNTNLKKREMSKKKIDVLNSTNNFLVKLKNLLLSEPMNYNFTDEVGNVLFSTEADDDTLEVGMPATPDGRFELPSGMVVIVKGRIITELIRPSDKETEKLQNRITELENALTEAQEVITDLKNQVQSSYNVQNRATVPAKKPATKTATEKKNKAQ